VLLVACCLIECTSQVDPGNLPQRITSPGTNRRINRGNMNCFLIVSLLSKPERPGMGMGMGMGIAWERAMGGEWESK
jgi:hypothetical protein